MPTAAPTIPTDPESRSAYFAELGRRSIAVRQQKARDRRAEQATDRLAAHIAKTLEKAPPLSDAQRARLADLLAGPRTTTAGKVA